MKIVDIVDFLIEEIEKLSLEQKIDALNYVKRRSHEISPFKEEPVDCVLWIKNESIVANDYNPNKVAPPEMELLKTSIDNDGYTQPIVTFVENNKHIVVDGYHRNRVGKEYEQIRKRVHSYLPVTLINHKNVSRDNRIASTIRHNRARGKHRVDAMSDIVVELKKRNWTNSRICKQLGMDEDEVLRLCQITGLKEVFSNSDFSKSWDIGIFDESEESLIEE